MGLVALPVEAATPPPSRPAPRRAPAAVPGVRLIDVTTLTGVTSVHDASPTPAKLLPETMGGGLALLDFDLDGDLDLYLVTGGSAAAGKKPRPNELWRNAGGLRFTRVADAAGATGGGLGMGACVGDVDGDGDPDLHVTNVGRDALYLNQGDGTFRRAPPSSGIAGDAWSCSCTFLDADGDSDLDLYVTSYVDFDPVRKNPYCGDVRAGVRAYCHPDVFEGVRDVFYRNDGRGTFREDTVAAGLERSNGKGLGVVLCDYDLDGDADLFVANDSTPNFLWRNDGRGSFKDVALLAGVAYDEKGDALAGMGVAAGDADGDGRPDLFVTNLDLQTNTLYLSSPRGGFRDATAVAGLAESDHAWVGFGAELWDFDFDGDLDLFLANGHIIDNIEKFNSQLRHAQPDQLLANDGRGRFSELGREAGDVGVAVEVSRGSATGDLDGDGDLDLVVTVNGGRPRIYRNDGAERRPHLVLELRGTRSNRDALGARVVVQEPTPPGQAPKVVARGEVQGGRSYLGDGTRRLHLACPPGGADVVVTWPGNVAETWRGLAPFHGYRLVEGASAQAAPPLRGRSDPVKAPAR